MLPITRDDIITHAPHLSIPAEATIQAWVGIALIKIRARVTDLDDLDQDTLRYVVIDAVAATASNPDNIIQMSVAADNVSESVTYRRTSGGVTITQEHWQLLMPSTRAPKRAFTIGINRVTPVGE